MKALWRVLVAASAALLAAGSPALAQDLPLEAPAEKPVQNDLVGPPQLKNFSLDGKVTRAAPAPVPLKPKPTPTVTNSASKDSSTASPTPQPDRETTDTRSKAPRREATQSAPEQPPELEPASPATQTASTDVSSTNASASGPVPAPEANFAPPPVDANVGVAHGGLTMLPWLVAALALGAAAAWYFLRQRPRESFAGTGGVDLFEGPSPAPAPPLRTPPPPPPAPKLEPNPDGLVSTRLRPWLEIEFKPSRAVVDDTRAAVAFEISIFNSGNAPARDVLIEASLFNAGPMQDQQIQLFFDNPVAKGDRIPVIPPMQKMVVNTGVFLQRDQVRAIEIEGRPLFVPMIAFNALYGWTRGTGQTSASYLIGKATSGDKLAPFRLDLGSRIFRNLDAREHQLRVRK
jgi:hypothetical protein